MAFRSGQWVKCKNDVPVAHRTADGFVVGIYCKGGKDATGETSPERVQFVDGEGMNLVAIEKGRLVNVALPVAECVDLQPVTDRNDIPAARLAGVRPDWQPSA